MMSKNNLLIRVLLINTLVYVLFNFAHPVTPQMLQEKNIMDSFNGISFALMSLGMVIGSPFWGKQLTKYNSKYILMIALVGYGSSQMLFGFAQNIYLMSVARILGGSFAASWTIGTLEYINQNTDQNNKTRYFAYLMVSNSIGGIVGQLLSGYLGTIIWIYFMFIIQLVGLSVIGIIVFLSLKPFKRAIKEKVKKQKEKLNMNIIKMLLLMLFLSLAYTTYNSQVGYYVSDIKGGSTLGVAEINSYSNFISLIVNIYIVGMITKYLSSKNSLLIGIIFSIIGINLLIFTNIPALISVTFLLLGITGFRPIIQKEALENTNQKSLMVISYLNSAYSTGMVLGATIAGISYAYNPRYILYLIFIFLALAFIINFIKDKKDYETV